MRLKSKPSQKKKFTANPRTKRDVLFLKKKKRDVLFKDRTDDRWVQRGAGPRAVTRIEEARPSPRTRTQETRQTDSGLQVGPRRKRPNNRSHLATARGTRFPARLSPSPWEPASRFFPFHPRLVSRITWSICKNSRLMRTTRSLIKYNLPYILPTNDAILCTKSGWKSCKWHAIFTPSF